MTIPKPTEAYDPLTAEVRQTLFRECQYLSAEEKETLEQACAFAFVAHKQQVRKSGEPYITHPIAVTIELARWRMDLHTLCAGLLHDVMEDAQIKKSVLAERFGATVAEMVDGLSKLEKLEFNDQAEHQAESFRKLILAMTKDVRVIIVKLSDRLHNMRTLGAKSAPSRRRIATETLEIYAPIANRLGLNHVYRELQDLSFYAMYPTRYRVLKSAMTAFKKNRCDVIERVLHEMNLCLVGHNIEAQIRGREKNLYGIHQKMLAKKKKFEELDDIYGFRIVVNNVSTCYAALGALHSLYQPKPGKFKDFIAIPKSNGYKSLHTTLNGPYGLPIQVQIRTREMNRIAESGIASHWAASDHAGKEDENQIRTNQWLQNILDLQSRSANAIEFLEHVKVDLFPNEMYITTPKGKILTLPRGASVIDFAYAVHTDVGHRCVGAKVNNITVPLRTRLKTGDTVEILTSPNGKPNPAWLNFTASSRARSAIRSYIKSANREDAVALGERLLAGALSSLLPKQVAESETLKEKYLKFLENNGREWEDVLYNVGVGLTMPVSVAMDIANLAGDYMGGAVKLSPIHIGNGINGHIHLGKCCMPLPGDAVRGIIAKDQGLIIHRDNCNLLLKSPHDQQLDADWSGFESNDKLYDAALVVSSVDTHALLAAMASAISDVGGNIASVDTLSKSQAGTEGFIEFRFNINVHDAEQLNRITAALHKIPQVRKVSRI